jgi:putative phage-type endonuclease
MDAAQLAERRTFLGASEVAAVVGLDPFKSPLDIWASKKGLIGEEQSIAADMGNLFEGPLLSYYAAKHGCEVVKPGTLRHRSLSWARATPDGITGQRNLQCKLVGARMLWHWQDGPPEYVQVQTQWEMEIAELPMTTVIANLGGTDYQEFEVQRDSTIAGYLIEICGRFWRDNVLGDRMPDVDGTERARAILAAKFPRPTTGMADAVPEFVQMALRYREINEAISAVKEEKDMLANAMRLAIGDKQGLKWPSGYVSWKPDDKGARRLYVHVSKGG